jgi:hypothetical protein
MRQLLKSLLKNNLLLIQHQPIYLTMSPLDLVIRISSESAFPWVQLTTDTTVTIQKRSISTIEPSSLIPVQKEDIVLPLTDVIDQNIYMTLFMTSQCSSLGLSRLSSNSSPQSHG